VGKNKFHHFRPPPGNFRKSPLADPPGKNPSDTHAAAAAAAAAGNQEEKRDGSVPFNLTFHAVTQV